MPAAFMPEDDLIKPPLAAQVTKTDFGVAREPNFSYRMCIVHWPISASQLLEFSADAASIW